MVVKYNKINAFSVIQSPIVTEKALSSSGDKISFYVDPSCTKQEIKESIEHIYKGSKVLKINIIVRKGKVRKFKSFFGKTKLRKKAIVKFEDISLVDITTEV